MGGATLAEREFGQLGEASCGAEGFALFGVPAHRSPETEYGQSFEEVVENNRWVVVGSIRSILGRIADEDDLVQEVFVRLVERLRQPGEICIGAWLRRVARNVAIDELRRTKAVPVDHSAFDTGTGDGLDAAAVRSEVRTTLERCLNVLPERQREALMIQAADDDAGRWGSGTRRAAAMGLSPEAFDSLVARGRARLRCEMSRHGIDVARAFTATLVLSTKRLASLVRYSLGFGGRSPSRRSAALGLRIRYFRSPRACCHIVQGADVAGHPALAGAAALIPAAVLTALFTFVPSVHRVPTGAGSASIAGRVDDASSPSRSYSPIGTTGRFELLSSSTSRWWAGPPIATWVSIAESGFGAPAAAGGIGGQTGTFGWNGTQPVSGYPTSPGNPTGGGTTEGYPTGTTCSGCSPSYPTTSGAPWSPSSPSATWNNYPTSPAGGTSLTSPSFGGWGSTPSGGSSPSGSPGLGTTGLPVPSLPTGSAGLGSTGVSVPSLPTGSAGLGSTGVSVPSLPTGSAGLGSTGIAVPALPAGTTGFGSIGFSLPALPNSSALP